MVFCYTALKYGEIWAVPAYQNIFIFFSWRTLTSFLRINWLSEESNTDPSCRYKMWEGRKQSQVRESKRKTEFLQYFSVSHVYIQKLIYPVIRTLPNYRLDFCLTFVKWFFSTSLKPSINKCNRIYLFVKWENARETSVPTTPREFILHLLFLCLLQIKSIYALSIVSKAQIGASTVS